MGVLYFYQAPRIGENQPEAALARAERGVPREGQLGEAQVQRDAVRLRDG